MVKPALKKTKVDPSNVTVVEVRYDAKSALSESNKLRIVIDNFDRILEEYKQPTKIPKLQKSKTCSIIESKCVLKKAAFATSMGDLARKSGGDYALARAVSSCDVSAKKSKIPVMAAASLRKNTPSGLNLPDRQKVSAAKSVQNLTLSNTGSRFAKSTQNLNKTVLLSMPKRRDYVCGVAKSMENLTKSLPKTTKPQQISKPSVRNTVQTFENGTYKKQNATVSRNNTYTKTSKVAKMPEKTNKSEVLPNEEKTPPPPPKNKIIQLISTFERKSTTTAFGGYTSDNSDDSGNISNEENLEASRRLLSSGSDDSLLLSPDDSGIEKTPEKVMCDCLVCVTLNMDECRGGIWDGNDGAAMFGMRFSLCLIGR